MHRTRGTPPLQISSGALDDSRPLTEANALDLRPSFIALEEFFAALNHTAKYDDPDKAITRFTSIIQRLAADFGWKSHAYACASRCMVTHTQSCCLV